MTLGKELYDKGWRQGCVAEKSMQFFARSALDGEPQAVTHSDDGVVSWLALTTQDCDLVKPEAKLPFLEGISCFIDADLSRCIRPNDARYFVLEPEQGLVADRAFATQFSRESLVDLPLPNAPLGGDPEAQRLFAEWLGNCYTRVAIPTKAVEHLHKPLVRAVGRLCGDGKEYEALNRDLHEIRVMGDLASDPPFKVTFVCVAREAADLESCRLGVAEVMQAAGFVVEAVATHEELEDAAVHIRRIVVAQPSRLTVQAYWSSIPLSTTDVTRASADAATAVARGLAAEGEDSTE